MNTGHSMKLDIYVNYAGHCENAFRFYEQHLGGKINMMMPHQQPPPNFPKEWKQPILHAIIEIGGTMVRGADIPGAEPMRSAYLTLRLDTPEKAEFWELHIKRIIKTLQNVERSSPILAVANFGFCYGMPVEISMFKHLVVN